MTRWSSAIWRAALLLLAATSLARRAQAQNVTTLTVTNGLSVPSNASIDSTHYNRGWVCATGSVSFAAVATTGNKAHTVTVYMRASGPITGGTAGKLADFQWNTTACSPTVAGTGWTSLTQTDAQVGTGSIKTGGPAGSDRVTGTIYFRLLLNWSTDAGGNTLAMPSLVFSVTQ